jgi:CRISPR-associated protein Csm4
MAVDLLGETAATQHFFDTKAPAIALSSAFPWRKDVCFFPKPLSLQPKWNWEEEEAVDFQKAWRSVKFISEELLRPALAKGDFFLKKEDFQDCYAKHCLSHKLLDNFYENVELPRVVLDRITNAATIFHFAQVTFEQDSGLFFLARFEDEKVRASFEAALRALGDEGIGGERSSGKGLFELKDVTDFEMPNVDTPMGCLNLSLFIPGDVLFPPA